LKRLKLKKMKKSILLSLVALVAVLSSCKKDRFDEPKAPQKMEELTVPASFDWKTTKNLQLTLTAITSGIVEITNNQGVAYQKAFLTPGQPYVMKLTVPTYEKNVKAKFMGQEQNIDLSSNNLIINF
jgi:protein-disulfide isomerase